MVLYAAPEFATAFVETVVRDRFRGRQNCVIAMKEITARVWARISMQRDEVLTLVDLRGDGCTRIGAPTETEIDDACRDGSPVMEQQGRRV